MESYASFRHPEAGRLSPLVWGYAKYRFAEL